MPLPSQELLHTLLQLVIIYLLVSRRFNRRDNPERMAADRAGLRIGLIAELEAFRAALRLNADLVAADALNGFPGKPFFTIYRGSMNRLALLSAPELAGVVAAHAASETLDAAVALRTRHLARPRASVLEAKLLNVAALQSQAEAASARALAALSDALAQDASLPALPPSLWARVQAGWLRLRARFDPRATATHAP